MRQMDPVTNARFSSSVRSVLVAAYGGAARRPQAALPARNAVFRGAATDYGVLAACARAPPAGVGRTPPDLGAHTCQWWAVTGAQARQHLPSRSPTCRGVWSGRLRSSTGQWLSSSQARGLRRRRRPPPPPPHPAPPHPPTSRCDRTAVAPPRVSGAGHRHGVLLRCLKAWAAGINGPRGWLPCLSAGRAEGNRIERARPSPCPRACCARWTRPARRLAQPSLSQPAFMRINAKLAPAETTPHARTKPLKLTGVDLGDAAP